jgi:hypothetical protein
MRRILTLEDLRPQRPTNLPVAIHKTDGEGGAGGPGRGLHAPGPHEGVPGLGDGVGEDGGGVDSSIIRKRI